MIRLLFFITLCCSGIAIYAQEAVQQDTLRFSLEKAKEYAVANNLNAENARLDVNSADSRVWESAASGLPQVNASANYNNNLALATTLIPDFFGDPSEKIEVQFGTKHFATAGVSASQLLFSGQYIVGLQTAKLFKEYTQKNLKRTEREVKEFVSSGYYMVLLANKTLESLNGNLANIRETYNETVELFEAGFTEQVQVDQLELAVMDLENAVLSMERQAVASENLLKYQMGIGIEQEIQLTDNLDLLVEGINIQQALSAKLDIEDNIDFRIMSDQENLALMDMKLKKTEYMPTISAFFSLDYTAQRDEFNLFSTDEDWYQASAVGLSLNVPVFSSGLRMAGVAQKRIEYEKAKNSREFAAEGIRIEFIQARYDFANAYEKFTREVRNLEISNKVIDNTRIKYNEGLASSLELTQVNDQYLQTLSNYTSAMVELLNAKTALEVIMNTI